MNKEYTAQFRDQAMKLVTEKGYGPAKAARELGIPDQTLSVWLKKAGWKRKGREPVAALSNDPAALQVQVRELQAQVKRLEMEKDILKSGHVLCEPEPVKFAWIQEQAPVNQWQVTAACRELKVSRSGYYEWKKRKPSKLKEKRMKLVEQIREVHQNSRCTYGSPRVTMELKERGVKVCENTVAKLMTLEELRSKTKRRFVPQTTDSDHPFPIAPNLLDRDFEAQVPNRKWCCDLTYIWTREGWLYLAVVLDLFSRKVVGWSMADHLRSELAQNALTMAIQRRKPSAGLMHHSDRGVQYACGEYRALLAQHQMTASMSRVGNCYDNAAAESFFSTLKTELVHHQDYPTREEAIRSIFEWIEVFYNRQRRHSTLGYMTPDAFEAQIN